MAKKITKSKIKQIIKEEFAKILSEEDDNRLVQIPDYGKLTISQIKNRLMRDLKDIGEKAAAGDLRGVGVSRLQIAYLFMKTLEDNEALENVDMPIAEEKSYPNNSTMRRLVKQAKMDGRYNEEDAEKLKKDYDKHVRGTLRDPKHSQAHKKSVTEKKKIRK